MPEADAFDEPDDRSVVPGVLAPALTAVVVLPVLAYYGIVLFWLLPEATGYTCAADDRGCHRDPVNTVVWWLCLAACAGAAISVALSWWRQWRVEWWRWPAIALGFLGVGGMAVSVLIGG